MQDIYETLIQGFLDKGFQYTDDFLSTEELKGLRNSLLQHYKKQDFHTAGIGNKDNIQTVKTVRNDQVFWLDKENANEVEQGIFQKMDEFVQYLNRTCYAGIRSYELHYAVYEKGSFYKKHVDKFKNDDRRIFSFVFYLAESWQQGDGGELIIYHKDDSTTTIEPQSGRMIFFNSELPHEVLISQKQRLSLTGWMKKS